MLTFAIYESENINTLQVKEYIKNYADNQYTIIKQCGISNIEDLMRLKPKLCLMDYRIYLENEEELKTWKKKNKIIFIFIAQDRYQMIDIVHTDPTNYCLLDPLKEETLLLLLDYIREHIKSTIIAVKIPHSGEEIIEVKNLNYINIAGRSLRFYMDDKSEVTSQSLRQSFSKEVEPMLKHPELLFIPPSLILNLENIKQLFGDHAVFKNGSIVYFPKATYDKVRAAWAEYHDF